MTSQKDAHVLIVLDSYVIKSDVYFIVNNPITCNDFEHLINKPASFQTGEAKLTYLITAVERYAHCKPWRAGELIAVRVGPLPILRSVNHGKSNNEGV